MAVFLVVVACSLMTLPPKLGAGVYVIASCSDPPAATPFLTISAYKPYVSRFGICFDAWVLPPQLHRNGSNQSGHRRGRLLGLNRPQAEVDQIQPRLASLMAFILTSYLMLWRRTTATAQEA